MLLKALTGGGGPTSAHQTISDGRSGASQKPSSMESNSWTLSRHLTKSTGVMLQILNAEGVTVSMVTVVGDDTYSELIARVLFYRHSK